MDPANRSRFGLAFATGASLHSRHMLRCSYGVNPIARRDCMKSQFKVQILGFGHGVLLLLLAAGNLQATTRTVTNLNDSGPGSLRDTIAASISGDTILFAAGLTGTIAVNNEILITRNLTIIGPGAANLKLQGNGFNGILRISTTTASLSGLRLSGGNALGGAISNGASLTLSRCVLSTNTAPGPGGGLYNSGTVTALDCTFAGNSASPYGGGLANYGTLTLSNCTVWGNTASDGGGIINFGTLTVISSTVSGNRATANSGGGIDNNNTLALRNSTVASNTAGFGGGGLYIGTGEATI